nr:hypothetical protein CFP56_28790 [Quercus suber]
MVIFVLSIGKHVSIAKINLRGSEGPSLHKRRTSYANMGLQYGQSRWKFKAVGIDIFTVSTAVDLCSVPVTVVVIVVIVDLVSLTYIFVHVVAMEKTSHIMEHPLQNHKAIKYRNEACRHIKASSAADPSHSLRDHWSYHQLTTPIPNYDVSLGPQRLLI